MPTRRHQALTDSPDGKRLTVLLEALTTAAGSPPRSAPRTPFALVTLFNVADAPPRRAEGKLAAGLAAQPALRDRLWQWLDQLAANRGDPALRDPLTLARVATGDANLSAESLLNVRDFYGVAFVQAVLLALAAVGLEHLHACHPEVVGARACGRLFLGPPQRRYCSLACLQAARTKAFRLRDPEHFQQWRRQARRAESGPPARPSPGGGPRRHPKGAH